MKDNLEFSQKTASNYVRVYEENRNGKLVTVTNLKSIYDSLIEHKSPKTTDKAEEVVGAEVVPEPEGKGKNVLTPACSKLYGPERSGCPQNKRLH